MAAGVGSRLRPLTDLYAKPVLPIDGRPVIATLLRELASAGVDRVALVTGYRAGQVETVAEDGEAFGLSLRVVRQPEPIGSADAVRRALDEGIEPPFLLTAADTVYGPGDVRRFLDALGDVAGALAVRRQPGRPDHTRIRVEDGRVVRVVDPSAPGDLTAAPLVFAGVPVAERVRTVCEPPYEPPYELAAALQLAIDAGEEVRAVEIGKTRDLTHPVDLLRENFPYLHAL